MAGVGELSERRKALGTMEYHREGWTTRGKFSVEVAYIRQFWQCEALTRGNKGDSKEWGDLLYRAARRWLYSIVDIAAFIIICLLGEKP